MRSATLDAGAGLMLREWRQRRHLSQMDLALEADVSSRHLSFVETGRARPSRGLLLHLAEQLEVPLRERNALLVAAGYAPQFGETPLGDASMTPVREAIDRLLASHEPFPAIVVDRHWDVVSANRPALTIMSEGLSPELLTPRVNALRISLHPHGLAPRIVNLGEWRAHLLARLRRQIALTANAELSALYAELIALPGGGQEEHTAPVAEVFVPLLIRQAGKVLAFFSTIATFGTPADVTVSELAIESFFPADSATAVALREAWQPQR